MQTLHWEDLSHLWPVTDRSAPALSSAAPLETPLDLGLLVHVPVSAPAAKSLMP